MLLTRHIEKDRTAPELFGNYWFNSDPITLRSLQGNVVVLFFWDHTSMTSLRAVKHMNRLHEAYADCGLVVIGVQVSEYYVVRDPKKKEETIRACGITFPVVADDEHYIADSYRIETLPTVCLIAPKGDIYDIQTPRGSFSRVERSIQYLLRQAGFFGELPFVEYYDEQQVDYSEANITPDFDLGYLHGVLGNSEGYNPELPAEYHDPLLYVEGKFYAEGIWIAGRNSFEFAGEGSDGYILFPYTGHDVDVVVGNETEGDSIRVMVDDKPVESMVRGSDISVESDGSTVLKIKALISAHLISSIALDSHTIKLIPTKKGTAFYRVSLAPFEAAEPGPMPERIPGTENNKDDADPPPFHNN